MDFDLFGAIVAANDDAGVFDFDGPPTVFDFPVADRTFFDFHGFILSMHDEPSDKALIRYYGFYSNKSRGLRIQGQAQAAPAAAPNSASAPSAKQARKRWAALLKQVYEVDPLLCPKCGAEMKVIAFIEQHQREVIEKILRHCGLWAEAPARAPPTAPETVAV